MALGVDLYENLLDMWFQSMSQGIIFFVFVKGVRAKIAKNIAILQFIRDCCQPRGR